MSTVAEFTVPVEALPGGDTLTEMPGIRIEIERIVPTQESALPYFWVWGEQPKAFIKRVRREPDIEETELLESVEDGALFRAEWEPNVELIQGINRLNATIIEASGTSENWRFQVRTQEREAFNEFQTVFQQQGIDIHLVRLYDLAELVDGVNRSLTPKQRETLVAAYQEGYFESPRQTTQEELGDRLGISRRAVSDRLQRGIQKLISTQLLPSEERT